MEPTLPVPGATAADTIQRLIVHKSSGESEEIGNLVHAFLARAESGASMTKMWTDTPGAELQFRLELAGWLYRDPTGNEHPLKHADIVLTGQVDWIHIELRAVTYVCETVAHGETTLDGQPVSLVIVERAGEEPQWLWYLTDTDKQHPWRLSAPPSFVQGQTRRVSCLRKHPAGLDQVTWQSDAIELQKRDDKSVAERGAAKGKEAAGSGGGD